MAAVAGRRRGFFAQFVAMQYVGGSMVWTVGGRAHRIWLELATEKLQRLLQHRAPQVILWEVMQQFEHAGVEGVRIPVASKPQLELFRLWSDEPVVSETVRGKAAPQYQFTTARGVVEFRPRGRYGPWWKEVT